MVLFLLNILGGAKDGLTQGSTLVSSSMQMIEDYLLQIALHFLHFTQNDGSLACNFSLAQFRVLNNIGQNLNSFGNILGQTLGIEHGLLARCVRVQVSAEVLNLQLQIGLGSFGSALIR